MSKYYLAYDYNRTILESLEKDAVYFAAGDFNAFPTIYLQAVEGIRPDVILADITGGMSRPAKEYLKSIDSKIDPLNKKDFQPAIINKAKRPVYFTAKSDIKSPSSYRVTPWGFVYRVQPKSAEKPSTSPNIFDRESLRNVNIATPLDDMGESIIANYYLMWGESLAAHGNKKEALLKYEKAAEYGVSSKEALNNIGATCAERGMIRAAERFFRKASSLYPGYLTGRRNLARILEEQGKTTEALAIYKQLKDFEAGNDSLKRKITSLMRTTQPSKSADLDKMLQEFLIATKDDPRNPAIYNNLGNVYAEKGLAGQALESYHKAIKLDPKYTKVYKNLSVFYRNVMHDEQQAAHYMERYHMLKKTNPRTAGPPPPNREVR